MSKSLSLKQIPNLTPIRFVLAFLVMIFHIALFSENRGFPFFNDFAIFHKGLEAVYMFFSLSGFLIIKQLYNEKKHSNTINLKSFYLRRILRIFPLYYLILTFGFLYYRFILPSLGFEFENNYDFLTGIFLTVTFFPNIFSTYMPGRILEILWSIGIEEQFYLFVAPILLLIPFKKIIHFLSLFTIVYFLLYFSDYGEILEKYNMLFFYFSFSGLCAILCDLKIIQKIIQKLRYVILLAFILFFTTSLFKNNLTPLFYNLFSMLLFGFTILVLAKKPIKILQNKTMNYLGKISYGVYMFHPIAMQLVGFIYLKVISEFYFNDTINIIIINIAIILITIVTSHYSFKYYESFFLKMKKKSNIERKIKIKTTTVDN